MSGHDTISALSASRTMHICPYCNRPHGGVCPLVKSIEYYPNGQIKVVEFKDQVEFKGQVADATTSSSASSCGPGVYKGQLVYAVSYYRSLGASIPQSCLIYVTNTPISYLEMTRRIEDLVIRSYPINGPMLALDIKITSVKPHDQMVPIPEFNLYDGSTGRLLKVH